MPIMSVSSIEASMYNTSVGGQETVVYKTDELSDHYKPQDMQQHYKPQDIAQQYKPQDIPQHWQHSQYWVQPQQPTTPIDYYQPSMSPQGYVEQDRMTPDSYLGRAPISPSLSGDSMSQPIPRSIGSMSPESQEFLLATSVPPMGDLYSGDNSAGDSDTIIGSGDDDDRANSTSRRRRAQNRVAQRAFRERKQQHVKELEKQLKETKDKYESLEKAHSELVTAHEGLKKVVSFLTNKDLDEKLDSVKEVLDILEESRKHALHS